MKQSLHALLTGIVDYAGLFPPAAVTMEAAVSNYARYRSSDHSWMLGRFVVGSSRLPEFVDALGSHVESHDGSEPWPVSAVVTGPPEEEFARVSAFNQAGNRAVFDSVETKAMEKSAVNAIAAATAPGLRVFVEVPDTHDPSVMLSAVIAARMKAKIRTGGVTADALPPVDDVATFIRTCYAKGLGFKATAGLHHPVRAEQALTYEENAPRGVMHGFLNVFLAAAFCYNGLGMVDTPQMIELTDIDEVDWRDDGVSWRDYHVSVDELVMIRRRFAISFGSCSFEEPIEDLQRLELM